MRPLSKLPIFLDLAGRRAVVVGGTAAAAWKAELLAAAGAHVEVYAVARDPEMQTLLSSPAVAGSVVARAAPWSPAVLDGAAIAVADLEADAEAQAFCAAARSAGVPVNVIDKPRFGQFQFGSIVNRSPVVVSISTDGAAPILGQAIRSRIEALLPPSLAAWGRLAGQVRADVLARLAKGAPRRQFWQQLALRAFGTAPDGAAEQDLERLIADISASRSSASGRVILVGAGPGDADMLTLKAVRALQSADVILFDDLVSDEVLELARREAQRMLVGKRSRRASCAQEDINALMIRLARQGKQVVRLKSGDPMIFGRAGEEIAELERHGIAVEIVPGITSALAMAAQLGVSLTHRDHARSVRFVTGHARDGELPGDLDWRGLADPATTLVVYMGARTASLLADRLLAAGMAPTTPAAVMAGATRDGEQRWLGSLAGLAACAAQFDTGLPVLVGIGHVFEDARHCKAARVAGEQARGRNRALLAATA